MTQSPIPDKLYDTYLQQRKSLIDLEQSAAQSYDKWLLTLSGGALGLSMAFVKDIALPAGGQGAGYLLVAWIALALAIVAGLSAIYLSQSASEESRKILDDQFQSGAADGGQGVWSRVREKQGKCKKAAWVGHCNIASMLLFMVGILLLSVFATLNIDAKGVAVKNEPPKPTESKQDTLTGKSSNKGNIIVPCKDGDGFGSDQASMKPPTAPVDQVPPTTTPSPPKTDKK